MGMRCPHCGKVAFSFASKLFLGPARTKQCDQCQGKVSIPWTSIIGLAPVLIGGYLSIATSNNTLGFSIIIFGGIMIFLIQASMPLEKR
ncbi:MAG: hypothetical protein CXT71_06045 [Methanobacteriota archaeon]|jgi:hypothetical protein|nr:MAG: hypothetical protein CXT71_06045 [Euryarchaeota archaeon]